MDEKSVSATVIAAIGNSDAKDWVVESTDEVLSALGAIPILQPLVALGSAALSIRERFFLKKLAYFLKSLSAVSTADRTAFIQRIDSDPGFKEQIGDKLVVVLDRFDEVDKATLLAKCFAGYLSSEIDYVTFRRLAAAIDSGFLDDLSNFLKCEDDCASKLPLRLFDRGFCAERGEPLFPGLFKTGLLELIKTSVGLEYQESQLGKTFKKLMCSQSSPSSQ